MANSESSNPIRSDVGDAYDQIFSNGIPPEDDSQPVPDFSPSNFKKLSHKKPTSSQVEMNKNSQFDKKHPGVNKAISQASTKRSKSPSSNTTPQSSSNSYEQHIKDVRASQAVDAESALHRYRASVKSSHAYKPSQLASTSRLANGRLNSTPYSEANSSSIQSVNSASASASQSSVPNKIATDTKQYYASHGVQASTKPSPQEKAERQAELDRLDAENEMSARMHYWNGDRDFGATQEKIRDFYQPSRPTTHHLNHFFSGIKSAIHSGITDLADKAYQKVDHACHHVRTWLYSHHLTPANYQAATLRDSNPMTSTIPFTGVHRLSPLVKYRIDKYRAQRYRQRKMQIKQYDYMHPKSLKEAMPRFSSDQARQGAYLMFSQVLPANRANPKLAEHAQDMVYDSVHFTDRDLTLMQNLNDNRKDSLLDTERQGAEYLSKHQLYIPTLNNVVKNEENRDLTEAFGGREVDHALVRELHDPDSRLNQNKQTVRKINELSFKHTLGKSPKDLFKSMQGFVNKTQKSMQGAEKKHHDLVKHVNEHERQHTQNNKKPVHHTREQGPEM